MKKVTSTHRKAPAKARKPGAPKTVEEYLARVPESSRRTFLELRAVIRSAVPKDAVETISYRIPAFKHKQMLVWFGAFSEHCSLFPTSSVIEAYKNDLKDFFVSKGTVQFPIDQPLPTALIKKLVKARVAQVEKES